MNVGFTGYSRMGLFENGLGVFSAFSALRGNAELIAEVFHRAALTSAHSFFDLPVGDALADAYVHK